VLVTSIEDVDRYLAQVRKSATDTYRWIAAQASDPLDLFRQMKFEPIGFHPIGGHALNLVDKSTRRGHIPSLWPLRAFFWTSIPRRVDIGWHRAPKLRHTLLLQFRADSLILPTLTWSPGCFGLNSPNFGRFLSAAHCV
jgi:hypothetical protein